MVSNYEANPTSEECLLCALEAGTRVSKSFVHNRLGHKQCISNNRSIISTYLKHQYRIYILNKVSAPSPDACLEVDIHIVMMMMKTKEC